MKGKIMACKACKNPNYKNWEGQDPDCAFENNIFSSSNWNCATANAIRDLCNQDEETTPNSNCTYCDDQYFSTIKVDEIDFLNKDHYLTLWVSWYKHRGKTDAMWLLNEYGPPKIPDEEDCLRIIEYYKNR